jgi:hypothetical protein
LGVLRPDRGGSVAVLALTSDYLACAPTAE